MRASLNARRHFSTPECNNACFRLSGFIGGKQCKLVHNSDENKTTPVGPTYEWDRYIIISITHSSFSISGCCPFDLFGIRDGSTLLKPYQIYLVSCLNKRIYLQIKKFTYRSIKKFQLSRQKIRWVIITDIRVLSLRSSDKFPISSKLIARMTNVRHVKYIPVIFHLARFQKKWLEAPLTDSQEPPTTSRINKGEIPKIDCLTNGVFRTSRPNGSKKEHEVKQRGPCYTGIQSGSQRVTKKKIPNKITKNRDRKSHCHVH